jgi:hypothetical protein
MVVFGAALDAVVLATGIIIEIITDDSIKLAGTGHRDRSGIIEPHKFICFEPFQNLPTVPVQLAVL